MPNHLNRTFKRSSMLIPDTYGEKARESPGVWTVPGISSWGLKGQVCRYRVRLLGICGVALVVGMALISCSTPQKNWTSSGGHLPQQGQMDTSEYYGETDPDYPLSLIPVPPKKVSWWDTLKERYSGISQR